MRFALGALAGGVAGAGSMAAGAPSESALVACGPACEAALTAGGAPAPSGVGPPAVGSAGEAPRSLTAGDRVALEELGPVVVNADGSLSRISNWKEMTAAEQEMAIRVVGKRNEARRARLASARGP